MSYIERIQQLPHARELRKFQKNVEAGRFVGLNVGIILDGNGSWAQGHHLKIRDGHHAGAVKAAELMRKFRKLGANAFLWGFSTDNWGRPKQEIDDIFDEQCEAVERNLDELHREHGRFIHLGIVDTMYAPDGKMIVPGLPEKIKTIFTQAENLTKNNDGPALVPLVNYSGDFEIQEIEKKFRQAMCDGLLDPNLPFLPMYYGPFTKDNLGMFDYVMRTSGEQRLSNLGWRAGLAEIKFLKPKLPDLKDYEFALALHELSERNIRHGARPGGHPFFKTPQFDKDLTLEELSARYRTSLSRK